MTEEIRLTKAIHHFVRGQLTCQESIRLLEENLESDEWLKFLETEMLLYEMKRNGVHERCKAKHHEISYLRACDMLKCSQI